MRNRVSLLVAVVLAFLVGVLAACGRAEGGQTVPSTVVSPEATVEITRITDATPPATHVWKQPTTIIKIETSPTASTSTTDPEMIERGKSLYERKECGKCHGDSAEGIPGQGLKLANTELTEVEFRDVLRTGGTQGNEHLYGTSAISESGITAVYAFLQSLE